MKKTNLQLKKIRKFIKNDICELPIIYSSKRIAFGCAEEYKKQVCMLNWYFCREIFHDDIGISNHIFINHKNGRTNSLIKFMNYLEEQLCIEKKSKVYKTYKKNCTLIITSKFWKTRLFFTLLTLLLRNCVKNNWKKLTYEGCKKCRYLSRTIPALKALMNGKICYVGENNTWYEQFCDLKLKEVNKYLLSDH